MNIDKKILCPKLPPMKKSNSNSKSKFTIRKYIYDEANNSSKKELLSASSLDTTNCVISSSSSSSVLQASYCETCIHLAHNMTLINDFYNITDVDDAMKKINNFDNNKLKMFSVELYNIISNNASGNQKYIDLNIKNNRVPSFIDYNFEQEGISPSCESSDSNVSTQEKKVGNYIIQKFLGRGNQAEVFLVKNNGNLFAMKKITKVSKNKFMNYNVKKEIVIMKKLFHKNIIRLHNVLYSKTNDTAYLILDYIKDGNLFNVNKDYKCEILDKTVIYSYVSQIIDGLNYLHNNNIIHNDLKPENILRSNDNIFISDFGVSDIIENNRRITVGNGTLLYFSPEKFLISDNIKAKSSDVWALGVIIFLMFYGKFPFFGKNYDEIKNNIIYKDPDYPQNTNLNEFDFFSKILHKDQNKRMSLKKILKHDLFKKIYCDITLEKSVCSSENSLRENFDKNSSSTRSSISDNVKTDVSDNDITNAIIMV